MANSNERKLVKILYIIPEGEEDAGQAEGLWAYSLGNQLYELQSIPVFVEYLNVEDIVRCDEPPDTKPVIKELVKRSGNRTLRVIFKDETPDDVGIDIIWELRQHGLAYEKAAFKRYMFNVEPKDDYVQARDYLRAKEEEGLLWLYEQPDVQP